MDNSRRILRPSADLRHLCTDFEFRSSQGFSRDLAGDMNGNLPHAIDELLAQDGLTDLFINGTNQVWAHLENGQVLRLPSPFADANELAECAMQLAAFDSKRLDLSVPFADISLPGGLRAHAVLASSCSPHTLISIRIHKSKAVLLSELISAGFATVAQADYLRQMLAERRSFLISGPTGSGKTTLLRSLLAECRQDRIVVLEDTPELTIDSERWVGLRTRQANVEGRGAIDLQSLVIESLRMKPERIVIGEVRSSELVPLLQALNTGHGGSAATLHANSLADVPNRLLAIAKAAGLDAWVLSELASSAISCVIQLGVVEGRRKIESIGEFSKTKQGWLSIEPISFAPHLQLVPHSDSQALMFA